MAMSARVNFEGIFTPVLLNAVMMPIVPRPTVLIRVLVRFSVFLMASPIIWCTTCSAHSPETVLHNG